MDTTQAAGAAVTIRIRRDEQTYPPGFRGAPWVYAYTTPVDVTWKNADGERPGPRAGEYITYGSHLASLRDMLKHKHGRNVVIIETWKQATS